MISVSNKTQTPGHLTSLPSTSTDAGNPVATFNLLRIAKSIDNSLVLMTFTY